LAKDSITGAVILAASIVGIIVYGLLIVYAWAITLRVTAFLGVALILAILAWIGYTMATTPAPEPIQPIPDMSEKPKDVPTK